MTSIFDSIKTETSEAVKDLRNKLLAEGFKVRHVTDPERNPYGGDHYELLCDDGIKAVVESCGLEAVNYELSNYAPQILRKTLEAYEDPKIKEVMAGHIEFFKQENFVETIQVGPISLYNRSKIKGKMDNLELGLE